MKTNFTIAFTILLFSLLATYKSFAQVAKFGDISQQELTMKQYPLDTAAEAVVLFDKGYTQFGARGITTERHIRIKVLKKSGYKWADFGVPYLVKGSVAGIKGYTYNLENGTVQKSKLDLKNAFDEKVYEELYQKKFTMPNVKEGSVIDVTYTIYLTGVLYNLPSWEFQTTIPTAWSEYHTEVPDYLTYKFLMQGYHPLYHSNKENKASAGGGTNHQFTWIMKDVPAQKHESFITTLKDYQAKIEFELQQVRFRNYNAQQISGSWDDIAKSLLLSERFGTQINKTGTFQAIVLSLKAQSKSDSELAEKIYNHVQSRMTWNKVDGFGSNNTVRKAYDEAKGNVGDINLMLIAMLREAGLDANPVLLSTRENGRPPKISPMLAKFNYVVAHVVVNGKEVLLDATEPLAPFGMLPVRALNEEGHLLKKNENRWVALQPGLRSQYIAIDATFAPTGELNGQLTESAGGYYALEQRKSLAEKGEAKFAESLTRDLGNYKLGKPTFENFENKNQPLQIRYQLTSGNSGQPADIIYLNPLMEFGKKENPLKLEERMYPLNFASPSDETIITKYTIPAGYVIDEAPKSVSVLLPENGGKFTYMVQQNGNELQVMSRVNINRPVFYAEEYVYLKEFYNQIVAKHAEQIVLKKSTSN